MWQLNHIPTDVWVHPLARTFEDVVCVVQKRVHCLITFIYSSSSSPSRKHRSLKSPKHERPLQSLFEPLTWKRWDLRLSHWRVLLCSVTQLYSQKTPLKTYFSLFAPWRTDPRSALKVSLRDPLTYPLAMEKHSDHPILLCPFISFSKVHCTTNEWILLTCMRILGPFLAR